MKVTICDGCGRRSREGEEFCAACGRSLLAGGDASPHGWLTMETGVADPVVRPEAEADRADPDRDVPLNDAEVGRLFLAGGGRPESPEGGVAPPSGAAPLVAEPGALTAATGHTPGGAGWRVRVSAAQAARGAAQDRELSPAPEPDRAPAPAGLPGWLLPVLIAGILLTSAAAVVIIVLHLARTS